MAAELSKPALDVGIVTTNADKMLAFYRDVLGFSTAEPISFPGFGTVHRLVVGESILRLWCRRARRRRALSTTRCMPLPESAT